MDKKPGIWGTRADISLAVNTWGDKYTASSPAAFTFPFWAPNDTPLCQTDDLTPHLYSDEGALPQLLSLPVIVDGRTLLNGSSAFSVGNSLTSIFLANVILSETMTAGDLIFNRTGNSGSTHTYLYYNSPTQIKAVFHANAAEEDTVYMTVGPRPWDLFFCTNTSYDYLLIKAADGLIYGASSSGPGGGGSFTLYTCASSDLIIAGGAVSPLDGSRLLQNIYESIAPPEIPFREHVDKFDVQRAADVIVSGSVAIAASATFDATCGSVFGGVTNVQAGATLSPDGLRHKMGVTTVACDAVISTFPKKIIGSSIAITATGTMIAAVVLKANIAFTGSAVIDAIVADAVAIASIPCSAVVSPPLATRIKFASSSGCSTSTGVLSISSDPLVTQYIYPDIVCSGIFYPVPKVKRDGDSYYTQDAFCNIQGVSTFGLPLGWYLSNPTETPATCVLEATPSKVNAAVSEVVVGASIDFEAPIIAVKVGDIACSASISCEPSFIYATEINLYGNSTGYVVGKITRGAKAGIICSSGLGASTKMIIGAVANAKGDSLFTVADPDRAGMAIAAIRCPCIVAATMLMAKQGESAFICDSAIVFNDEVRLAEQAEIAFICDSAIVFNDDDVRLAYQAEANITAEAIVFPDGKPWSLEAVDFFANAVMAGFCKLAPRGDSDIQCGAWMLAMGTLLTMAGADITGDCTMYGAGILAYQAGANIVGDCTVYGAGILAYQGKADITGDCTMYAEGWIPVSDKATDTRCYYVPGSSREYIVPYENRQIEVV